MQTRAFSTLGAHRQCVRGAPRWASRSRSSACLVPFFSFWVTSVSTISIPPDLYLQLQPPLTRPVSRPTHTSMSSKKERRAQKKASAQVLSTAASAPLPEPPQSQSQSQSQTQSPTLKARTGWADDKDRAVSAKFEDDSASATTPSNVSPHAVSTPTAIKGRRGSLGHSLLGSPNSRSPQKASYEDRLFSDPNEQLKKKANEPAPEPSALSVPDSGTTTPVEKKVKPPKPNNKPEGIEEKKSQKQMTKAERRELQERQRAEKAARQAEAAASAGKPGGNNAGNSKAQQPKTPAKQAPAPNSSGTSDASRSVTSQPSGRADEQSKKKSKGERVQDAKMVPLFSHLDQYRQQAHMDAEIKSQGLIHPAIMDLGLLFSEFIITGGNARCMAMMDVFKQVIGDYVTPQGTSLQRHLTWYISKQIDFLTNTRALAASMRNAIRYVKNEIAKISIDTPDNDAKELICKKIDEFVNKRIIDPDAMIVENALKKIQDGDVILIYAHSSVVAQLLLEAHAENIKFRVIVIDSRPKFEGKEVLKKLVGAGVQCTYALTNALGMLMKEATKVFLGASTMLPNGALMSRVGTSLVAMMAHDAKVPVIVCCEAYKFTDIVRLDSFVWNELGNPEELADTSVMAPSSRQPSMSAANRASSGVLGGWRDIPPLKLLNLHYDITPPQFITVVVCEHGLIPSTSVQTVTREIPIPF
ncbi:uncharacterized protein BJ171DRAFT_517429 [Polychytrium aggregatum]|uniref:uncharacterized protein n=1 Tax=Polychytrium aggregatum TaxID=110093 RepID=UPI0022FEDFA2|nr:uncharacterized protein BJ171DRAFT_517429 [Polychytrium aggregatum]KAI9199663.1 hypothetical protein BJ171DRAFT_517429 [Polychytrium aggregatum]